MSSFRPARPIRVLHCPSTVGGNPQQLARAERALGLNSVAVAFRQNYINYPTDEVLTHPGDNPLIAEARRYGLLWRALRDFDIIHFNFGQTITPVHFMGRTTHTNLPRILTWLYDQYTRLVSMRELPLLARRGKGIVVTFQGDDARQGDFCREHFDITLANEVEPEYYTPRSDRIKRQRISGWANYAHQIYALNPDLLYVLPPRSEFLPYATVDLQEWSSSQEHNKPNQPFKLLHAPSHRGAKGTSYVLDTVRRLQEEDRLKVELILIEGQPHEQVRQIYPQADLLVDQLLAGWYGGLAVELMALGKPVVCYIREQDLNFIPNKMALELPVINATPVSLYSTLKEWLTSRVDELPVRGARGREFVETWHNPLTIAARLKQKYEEILDSI